MARICAEYECEEQRRRRPTNLLEALEQEDHRREQDVDAVGEEKVAGFLRRRVASSL